MTPQSVTTTPPTTDRAMDGRHGYRRPVPFGRLVLVHMRVWRVQRGVSIGFLLILAAGLLSAVGMMATMSGPVTYATVASRFGGFPVVAFTLLWMAVGAVAGASPFKAQWAAVVLTVAPRRGRWLAASLVAFLLSSLAVAIVFVVSAGVVTAAILAGKGHSVAAVLGMGRPAALALTLAVVQAGLGFLLGSATRSVAAAIIIGYVVTPLLPLLKFRSLNLGRWLDINAATGAISAGGTDGRPLLPIITAAVLWVCVPALVAWLRLRSSVG